MRRRNGCSRCSLQRVDTYGLVETLEYHGVDALSQQHTDRSGSKDIRIDIDLVVVESAFTAVRDGLTGYTASAGLPELRECVARHYSQSLGLDLGPEPIWRWHRLPTTTR